MTGLVRGPHPPPRWSEAGAAERADELLTGVHPFSNDPVYWPSADELAQRWIDALPGIARLAVECETIFGEELGRRRFRQLEGHLCYFSGDMTFPENHERTRQFALDRAAEVRNILARLDEIPPGDGDGPSLDRGSVIRAAELVWTRLDALSRSAVTLSYVDPRGWAFDL